MEIFDTLIAFPYQVMLSCHLAQWTSNFWSCHWLWLLYRFVWVFWFNENEIHINESWSSVNFCIKRTWFSYLKTSGYSLSYYNACENYLFRYLVIFFSGVVQLFFDKRPSFQSQCINLSCTTEFYFKNSRQKVIFSFRNQRAITPPQILNTTL